MTQFKPGDRVFGGCRGACAEYACAAEVSLAISPAAVTLEQAATVPIDRRYPLSEAAKAIRYLEEGHTSGKVVITVA